MSMIRRRFCNNQLAIVVLLSFFVTLSYHQICSRRLIRLESNPSNRFASVVDNDEVLEMSL